MSQHLLQNSCAAAVEAQVPAGLSFPPLLLHVAPAHLQSIEGPDESCNDLQKAVEIYGNMWKYVDVDDSYYHGKGSTTGRSRVQPNAAHKDSTQTLTWLTNLETYRYNPLHCLGNGSQTKPSPQHTCWACLGQGFLDLNESETQRSIPLLTNLNFATHFSQSDRSIPPNPGVIVPQRHPNLLLGGKVMHRESSAGSKQSL